MADPTSMIKNMLAAQKDMEEMVNGKPLSEVSIDKKSGYKTMFNRIGELVDLKTKGFGGKGIDVGPIAGYYPETVSSIASMLEGLPEKSQGDRAKLNQTTLWFMNPLRKEVTGAQAAVEELKKWILPMIPTTKDDDATWKGKALQAAKLIAGQYKDYIGALKASKYNVGDDIVDTDMWVKDLENKLYGGK